MHSHAEASPAQLFLPDLVELIGEFRLEGDEAHYLSRVVRARPGETVRATNGEGLVATFEVLESRPEVRLRRISIERRTIWRWLSLAVGAVEGDRVDWLVEKAAELGAVHLVPLDCERAKWKGWRAERLDRLATAALKQSLGSYRLVIDEPVPFSEWIAGITRDHRFPSQLDGRFVASGDGGSAGCMSATGLGPCLIAVGPSSGFSDSELKALDDNEFQGVALAVSRLRTETAAVAAAAWWACNDHELDDQMFGGGPGQEYHR